MARHGIKRSAATSGPSEEKRPRLDPAQPAEAPSQLPVRQVQHDVAALVREQQVLILVAETGSGKTTQARPIVKLCSHFTCA